MSAELISESGPHSGQRYFLEEGVRVTFGRAAEASHEMNSDGHMSSVHFEAKFLAGFVEVTDLQSRNGTWVNNKRIQGVMRLRDGDRVRAGKTVFLVRFLASKTGSSASAESVPTRQGANVEPNPARKVGLASAAPAEFQRDADFQRETVGAKLQASIPTVARAGSPIESLAPPMDIWNRPTTIDSQPNIAPIPLISEASNSNPLQVSPVALDVSPRQPTTSSSSDLEEERSFLFNTSLPDAHTPFEETIESSFLGKSVDPNLESQDIVDAVPRKLAIRSLTRHDRLAPGIVALKKKSRNLEREMPLVGLLDHLHSNHSVGCIVHFEKIGLELPGSLSSVAIPMVPWVSEPTRSPVFVPWNCITEHVDMEALMRLWVSDACIGFAGSTDELLAEQVSRLSKMAVEGYSEEGGFLAACWPSSLLSILTHCNRRDLKRIFGTEIDGCFLPLLRDENDLVAFSRQNLASTLIRYGFDFM